MSKSVVVVESPTKVKTIKKYLGKDFDVVATMGHLKDLPKKDIGVDINNNFLPTYEIIAGKQKVITALKQSATNAADVFLAPDPDREGEAIAFHVKDILKKKGRNFYRVLFHELTKKGITDALATPQSLNESKYDAQQARRILDRLVGYQISPLLWKKVKYGLSAGRVQSVAVRIICERERAVQIFLPEEYWSITALLEGKNPPQFSAKLAKKNNKNIKLPDEKSSTEVLEELKNESFIVDKITKKTVKRNPQPPFITSKLQQEAIKKLNFSAKKTMMVAQDLYEGIELGEMGSVGLITYMRTDSTRIADEAAKEALKFIDETYGKDFVIDSPRFFKNKKKVQDAHEAIRPTDVFNTPEKVAPFLNKEQLALYKLIWQRFVASQMKEALIDQTQVAIKAGNYLFTATGSTIKFKGFMIVYISSDEENDDSKDKSLLPNLSNGEILKLIKLEPKQHFTQPPPRFTEASLVKELEENGIGRPSTYATILSTIREKGYVEFINKNFKPTELGLIVNDLLVESFPEILNVDFTAKMENELDRVEANETKYTKILEKFYDSFKNGLDSAVQNMLSMKKDGIVTDVICASCEKKMTIKIGKNGPFLACSGYPECSHTKNYTRDEKGNVLPSESIIAEVSDKICDKCGKPMLIKKGRFGEFLACSGYPECKTTISLKSGPVGKSFDCKCPEKGCEGGIVEKRSKKGKIFYGCNKYPDCKFAIWNKPIAKECPQCGASYLVEKTSKKNGTILACNAENCGYTYQNPEASA
ncbi:MAG: type I DNA topoisomerase [Desulfobacterales bacterium]|nr:type I DNA topoisomerase [Desulfobacterales bacterium]